MNYTIQQLAQLIDHTNLYAAASKQDIEKLCDEAVKYQFKMVAINEYQTHLCAMKLAQSKVHVGAAISFPLGQTDLKSKLFSAQQALNAGADEIDYVVNLSAVKNKDYAYVADEMQQMVKLCHHQQAICKVIFENCYLKKEEISTLAKIAKNVKPDFIKTSTGFGISGATIEDVKLMKQVVGHEVNVKAAGGIRDAATFIKMIQAGATRIGTSSGIKIIEELQQKMRLAAISELEI